MSDAGKVGLGRMEPGTMGQPRGKMLGGSTSLNYMAYVRGHPGDFDSWAKDFGATGWSFADVLPYFKKSEALVAPSHAPAGMVGIEDGAHGTDGPMGVSVRAPIIDAAQNFMRACHADGLPTIDYNGTTRGGPAGGCSLFQTTTKDGKRTSTYQAFLEPVMGRPNLKVYTGAHATKLVLAGGRATGVEFRIASGETVRVTSAHPNPPHHPPHASSPPYLSTHTPRHVPFSRCA